MVARGGEETFLILCRIQCKSRPRGTEDFWLPGLPCFLQAFDPPLLLLYILLSIFTFIFIFMLDFIFFIFAFSAWAFHLHTYFPVVKVSYSKGFHFHVVTEGRPGWFVNRNGEVSMQNVPAVPSEPKRRRVRHAWPGATSRLG